MRVVVVTKEGMDYSRGVNDWLREFERRTGKELETMDPETRAGSDFAQTYGIMEYPTILAIGSDGREMGHWGGVTLPTIDEVAFYAREGD